MEKNTLVSVITLSTLFGLPAQAVIYSIDLNNAANSLTAPGWSGLNAPTTGDGGTVIVGGVDFTVASSDGSRLRGSVASPNPNALTGDFVFDDGAGQALVLFFGFAGDLPAGDWLVEVWTHESSGGLGIGGQTIGFRTGTERNTGTVETEMVTGVLDSADATIPSTSFQFTSDGVSAYDLYVRESNDLNRSRLNAVRLTQLPIPEPSSAMLALVGSAFLLRRRRSSFVC